MDLSIISLVVSIHGRPQASIAAIFRQSAGYVFLYIAFLRAFFTEVWDYELLASW